MTGGFYEAMRRARTKGLRAACALAFACAQALPGSACAQTLSQAWDRAVAGEPGLLAARASQRAASERFEQARGALLPQLDASYNNQRNNRTSITEGSPFGELEERYPTKTAAINLTQPLWRPLNWATLSQARESEAQAALQTYASEQDLHTRFVGAWFDLMAARDNVQHAADLVEATRQQDEVMRRGLALGTHNEVQASDANARYQQAIGDQALARADLEAKTALLEQLTGPLPGFLPPAWRAAEAQPLFAGLEPLDVWLARVEIDNPAVRAAEKGVSAAREEVRRQQYQHSPTLDLVARQARNLQGAGTSPGQAGYRSREYSVGVQVNVPLFAGGTTQAKVREAEAMAQKAEADLDAARRNANVQARQGWASAHAARVRGEAAAQAVRAAQVALRAALTGQGSGLKTPLDELQAREQLAAAERDRLRAHYDGVVGLVKLRAAAGQPPESFLALVESLLGTPARP